MTKQKPDRQMRHEVLCILLLSLLLTAVAYINYRPVTGPTGALFIGKLDKVRSVAGAPGYLALRGFGDDDDLRLSRTAETLTLLDNPDALGKEYTIRAEKKNGNVRTSADDSYYQVTSMEATDGSFAFTWEDYAAVQSAALWWELPLAFGAVWVIGGIYLYIQHTPPPKRYRKPNQRKYKRRK